MNDIEYPPDIGVKLTGDGQELVRDHRACAERCGKPMSASGR